MEFLEAVIHIQFVDRSGLGYEVFAVFEEHRIEKVAMEVSVASGMLIKFKYSDTEAYQQLLESLREIPGVDEVTPASEMPYEVRENQLRAILEAVSEGILAVDRHGFIIDSNGSACQLLQFDPAGIRGQSIFQLLGDGSAIRQTLNSGLRVGAFAGVLRDSQGGRRYLGSSLPVTTADGQVVGAVITLKGEQQIEEFLTAVRDRRNVVTFDDIVHQSEPMRRAIATARHVARSGSTVLLRGESGTGKELFARAIHTESPRAKGPFVAINCGALPDSLLESELFGYEPGAFTGAAKTGKKGLFEQAHDGTLLLDEVGELSLPMQVKLLRVLQEGVVRRVGGQTEIPVNVRVIAATNQALEEMVRGHRFRDDLYYRLNVVPVWIPPLRDRKDDIPWLSQVLLRRLEPRVGRSGCTLTADAVQWLMRQVWPGNVRQLENTLERMLNVVQDDTLMTVEQLQRWADVGGHTEAVGGERWTGPPDQNVIADDGQWPKLKEAAQAAEKALLEQVLVKFPSTRKAGQVLGVSNTTILNKMRAYHLEPSKFVR